MPTQILTSKTVRLVALALLFAGSLAVADSEVSGDSVLEIKAQSVEVEPPPTRANCELRMLEPGQAGSIYLTTFAPSKQDCLKLSDDKTKAEFKPVLTRRSRFGIGPKED